MTLNYFYGNQAEQFSFYRIPKALFTDPHFMEISAEAKILYGIMLDRMSLSQKNGWFDEHNRVYIIFTLEEVMAAIGCADNKATRLLSELETKAGLIERKRQGLGKPNLIYVKNFIVDNSETGEQDLQKSRIKNRENHDSGIVKITNQESPKSRCNNTDINKTDCNDTEIHPIPSGQSEHNEPDEIDQDGDRDMDERRRYRMYFEKQLEVDILLQAHPTSKNTLEEILTLLVDTVCTKRKYIRIAGDDKPIEVVKGQFMKLDYNHIEYVLSSLKENTGRVRNIKQYLLTSLYNAPMTISNYYDALVRHDMANRFF